MAMRYVMNPVGLMNTIKSSIRTVSVAAREVLSSLPDSEISSLKNGFRTASESNARPTATVGVWIDAGSRFETEENNGVANFFEHMLYKGTAKKSKTELEKQLESIGARLNSYTSREHTALFAQCLSKDVDQVVALIADMIRNCKLDEATIEKERSVILKKLEEAEDDYEGVVFTNLHSAAFQGTPLAKSITGQTEVIKSINGKMLKDFVEDSYKPIRMVLAGVGGVEHAHLAELSEKYFGDMSNDYSRKMPGASGTRFTGSEIRYRDDNIPLMYGAIAVEGVSRSHPDYLPLEVANTFIGSWDRTYGSSVNAPLRLAQKLSLANDLHLYRSFSMNYKDTGLFGIYFVVDGNDHNETLKVVKTVQKEWKHLASGVTEDEVDRVKNMLKTNVFQSFESNAKRVDDIAKQVLDTGKIESMASLERDIESIDKSLVREAVSRHVYDRDIVCSGVGKGLDNGLLECLAF
ncbi:unnamed protein product [Anisakis simplex]|uniref:Cytochrome b-c1 complex subunit 1, mitochondrial (inferred by orthology to a C. elegans protein) n=1 Tax=Anisakis simplex TaxID=6269 RepID=A0A0M3K9W1_ANISI|nr:unnamed protein product [Anisakis simplex]